MPPPDAETLARLKARDSELLTRAVNENTEALLAAAWSLGWQGADADELVQETFTTFVKTVENFEGRSALKTFLIGILYKKALEKRRTQYRELATDPVDEVFERRFGLGGLWSTQPRGPEAEADTNETARILGDCLQALPEAQRLAFHLREVEGATTEELCNILAVSTTHLGVLIFRARNRLRECIQKKWKTGRSN